MPNCMRIPSFLLILAAFLVTPVAADYLAGDLNKDDAVNMQDLVIFAKQWLDGPGCAGHPTDCADLDGQDGVNWVDFALFADNWPFSPTTVVINEFMASNDETLADEDGDYPDWIELVNISENSVDIDGWFLKDENNQWQFPSGISLEPGDTLVVLASGKERNNDQNYLHTNFELNKDGDYLALVHPDGVTVEDEVGAFSDQRMDISIGLQGQKTSLISPAASAKYIVPGSDIGTDWRGGNEPYSESGWSSGTAAVGYSTLMDSNLQAYYAFDGSGSTATDSSNYGRDGTINGATRIPEGKIGGALDFDGENDVVNVNVPGYMQQMTISMWVNFDFVSEPNPPEGTFVSPISHVGEEIGAFSFIINSWGYLRFTVAGQSDECMLVSSDTISLDTWHHIVITYDNINHLGQIYFDGQLEGFTENTVGPVLVGGSTIGMSDYEGFCDAQFDEVAIWNRILDQDEVVNLTAGVSAGNLYHYDDLINTDIQAQMQSSNASVYTRCAFNVTDLSDIEYLTLKMQYDDGFAAFLNGTEVARRNAPSSVLWNSAATSSRPNKDCMNFENINLTSYIDLLKTGTNILAIQGLNISASDEDFLLSPQLYGYTLSADTKRYFTEPSPGELNDDGYIDLVADTTFSPDRGYYDSAFNVTINCNTDGAAIRYTLDGSEPGETHGSTYTSPIYINATTCLRAAAFKSGWLPSNIDTQTYIFASDVATQPANPPGMPSTWKNGYPADYEMDQNVVNFTLPGYGIEDALLSIPTISIVTDHDHLWSEETGIYYNDSPENEWAVKEQNKRLWERPTSVEFIYPDNNDGYQIDCGIRIHGAITRSHEWTPKHSFRLFFRGDYDNKKLVYPLFPDSDVDRFDQIVLRACSGNSWTAAGGDEEATYITDQWMRDTSPDMGQPGSHGIFAHVYLNGLYWGLYNPSERLHDSFWAEHLEGDKTEYDVIKDWVELHSGSMDAWNQMIDLTSQGLESEGTYQKIQGNNPDGSRNPDYPILVDVDNLIDYIIPHIHSNAVDWAGHNWWGARRRGPESEGFKFGIWDQEIVFGIEGRGWQEKPAEEVDDMGPAYVYDKLRRNESFKMQFADRVHKHMFNDGALTIENNQARWMSRVNEIDKAIVGESARWGDIWEEGPYTREDHWLYAVDDINSWYFPEIHLTALQRFKNVGLYPDVNAPTFYINGQYQHGGYITPPASLTMSAPAGTIYYTTDGNDPYEPFKIIDTNIILTEDAPKKVLIPTVSNPSGTDWRTSTSYNDSSWTDYILTGGGTGGVGYGLNGEYEDYISYNVESEMEGVNTSCYIRILFSVTADILSEFNKLKFKIRYDDGFIAYLNGTQIAGDNYSGTQWDSYAEGTHDGDIFEEYDITDNIGQLGVGDNLLAIHGLINPLSSPELLVAYNFEGNLDDSSGNGYNGVPSSNPAPSYTSDAHSGSTGTQCLLLNGSNYVEIPLGAANPLDGSVDFTTAAWIKKPSAAGDCLLSCSDGTPNGPTEHPMSIWYDHVPNEGDGVDGGMSYDNWWAGQVNSWEYAVYDVNWHHMAVTYQASSELVQLYIDGEMQEDDYFNPDIPDIENNTIRIGLPIHDWDGNLNGWNGVVDELAIFAGALSQQQIQNIMSNGLLSSLGSTPDEDFLISAELFMQKTSGNTPSDSALEYTDSPITLTETTQVKARAVDGGEYSALNEAVYAVESVKDNLRITEIMYHPPDPNHEFIEFKNIGPEAINLNLVSFTDGIDFTFPFLQLNPCEYIVVVKNETQFEAKYGAGINIAGQYFGSLDNAGEDIKLEDALGETILDFDYEDNWYDITDGAGFSLTVRDPNNADPNDWGDKKTWRPSAAVGGSPGWDDTGVVPQLGAIVINELLAHSHAAEPDWIELYNTTAEPINIGGWFLSDSDDDDPNRMKYKIADDTVIDPNGYVVFYEDQHFGNIADTGCHEPFALSENGETLYLQSGQNGILTGYYDDEKFDASETNVAFGRYYKASTGTYNFVAMSENTPGNPNAYPKVGPIVISEIMYHPRDPNLGSPYTDDDDFEYVELRNITASAVTLQEYDNELQIDVGWRFTDEDESIDFIFPLSTTIPPGGYLLLVKDEDAFNYRYTAPTGAVILEWGDGKCNNGGEKINLQMPGDMVGSLRYYIRIDRVNYSDGSHPEGEDPWPSEPDGTGKSLNRKFPSAYGNDVANWQSTPPTPGH